MTNLITYGTFDLLHVGHIRLLRRLKSMSTRLIIGLSNDEFNILKGKKTIIPYEERKEMLLATRYVDSVFPETCWEQKKEDIIREKAEIFAMGDDWVGKFDYLQDYCKVIYLSRTSGISTTNIKLLINKSNLDEMMALSHSIDQINNRLKILTEKYLNETN
jgi:glycerol-3-phosphate cytidylyltransferase